LENFAQKSQIFFPSGRFKKYPSERQVYLSFTAGQKYARVGSGAISTHVTENKKSYAKLIMYFTLLVGRIKLVLRTFHELVWRSVQNLAEIGPPVKEIRRYIQRYKQSVLFPI